MNINISRLMACNFQLFIQLAQILCKILFGFKMVLCPIHDLSMLFYKHFNFCYLVKLSICIFDV